MSAESSICASEPSHSPPMYDSMASADSATLTSMPSSPSMILNFPSSRTRELSTALRSSSPALSARSAAALFLSTSGFRAITLLPRSRSFLSL